MALYDPKEFPSEVTVSPDFTLEDVLAWARTKPADEAYEYCDTGYCAIGQFLRDTGKAENPSVAGFLGRTDGVPWRERGSLNYRYAPLGVGEAALESPRTFGAFADRLEQALAQ